MASTTALTGIFTGSPGFALATSELAAVAAATATQAAAASAEADDAQLELELEEIALAQRRIVARRKQLALRKTALNEGRGLVAQAAPTAPPAP
jgi:acyl CoA:acetate/3-ketoacid CoA transferase